MDNKIINFRKNLNTVQKKGVQTKITRKTPIEVQNYYFFTLFNSISSIKRQVFEYICDKNLQKEIESSLLRIYREGLIVYGTACDWCSQFARLDSYL
jgi:hypothetical protein